MRVTPGVNACQAANASTLSIATPIDTERRHINQAAVMSATMNMNNSPIGNSMWVSPGNAIQLMAKAANFAAIP
jgi:hypothetical protein